MKVPQIGNSVIYFDDIGKRAAIVTAVHMNDNGIHADAVNLVVFGTATGDPFTMYVDNVGQGDSLGQWQWPDMVEI